MKICTHCKCSKPLSEFWKHKQSKDGLQYRCVTCLKETKKAEYQKNKEKILLDRKVDYKKNPSKYKEYRKTAYKNNKEKRIKDAKIWQENNKDKARKIWREYYYRNKKSRLAAIKARRAAKINRTPAWADLEAIKEVYKNCPEGMHVDHIIPLQGKEVSGLHVENNLQYLTPEENLKKSNKLLENERSL